MISILSWNIQNGKGVDNIVSLQRIADVINTMDSADVICLQEVSNGLVLQDDTPAPNQLAELATLFPDYEILFGIAVDSATENGQGRWQFGNVVLSKLPIISAQHHLLPKPAVAGVRYMQRQATEIIVDTPGGALKIVNLHLEFHSLGQRMAQIGRLRQIHSEAMQERTRAVDATGPYQAPAIPIDTIYCGDFNMLHGSGEYKLMTSSLDNDLPCLKDAWSVIHPDQPHAPTCGIFDDASWPEGPHCRDFFFVSANSVEKIQSIEIDTQTAASDHQPLKIILTH